MSALLVLLLAAGAYAYEVPRTSYGDPDLQGFWSNSSLTTLETPKYATAPTIKKREARRVQYHFEDLYERDDVAFYKVRSRETNFKSILGVNRGWMEPQNEFAVIDGEIRTSWITDPADGRIPYLPEVRSALLEMVPMRKLYFNPETITNNDRCLMGFGRPAGPPMLNEAYNTAYQIAQSPGHVAIWVENVHDVRMIRLGAKRLPSVMKPWLGDSVGHWEGDTLVVKTRNMNPQQSESRSTHGRTYISPEAIVTEYFTRVSPVEIRYKFEIDAPRSYSQIWRGEIVFNRIQGPVYEYACHEGNRSIVHQMEGARLPGLDPNERMLVEE